MDPTAIAAAVGQFMSFLGQRRQEAEQRDLMQLGINRQNVADSRQWRLATAPRTDAQGNRTYFDGTGFVTEANPVVKAIMDAAQREQLKATTVDADRNREAAVRNDNRSRQASDVYNRKFTEYANQADRPERSYIADAILSAVENRDASTPVNTALVAQAIRSGDSRAIRDAGGRGRGESLASTIRNARKTGTADFVGTEGARDQQSFSALNALRSIADGTMPANTSVPDYASILSNAANGMADRATQLAGRAPGTPTAVGSTPDYAALFTSIINATKPGDKGDPELEKLKREAAIAEYQATIAKNRQATSAFRN